MTQPECAYLNTIRLTVYQSAEQMENPKYDRCQKARIFCKAVQMPILRNVGDLTKCYDIAVMSTTA